MIGIGCLVVIGKVAAHTRVGGCIVIPVMTGYASHADMGACENIIVVVYRESSRCPVWVGSMTCIAGCRIVARRMIRID